MLLTRKLLGITKIASKDEARPVLTGVLFDKDEENKPIAVATDGYQLMIVDLPKQDISVDDVPEIPGIEVIKKDERMVIGANDLQKAIKCGSYSKDLPVLNNLWTAKGGADDRIKLVSTDLNSLSAPEMKLIDAEFPAYKRILPVTEPKAKVALNIAYLKNMVAAFEATGINAGIIEIEVHDTLAPVVFKAKQLDDVEANVYGLLMPIRVS